MKTLKKTTLIAVLVLGALWTTPLPAQISIGIGRGGVRAYYGPSYRRSYYRPYYRRPYSSYYYRPYSYRPYWSGYGYYYGALYYSYYW